MRLVFRGGCDLTTKKPRILNIISCIKRRYDAGITNHDLDNTGVIEIWKLEK